jgi:D-alanyl-D-alanine carboxypeptidase
LSSLVKKIVHYRLHFHLLFLFPLLALFFSFNCYGQDGLIDKLDSLLSVPSEKPFNGVVWISGNGVTNYYKIKGYADWEKKTPLTLNSQYFLGSISKQFTAVLVLQEYDKGRLKLEDKLSKYLPDLNQSWADSVTIHQMLNHTSGIVGLDKPLEFEPGSKFSYSPIFVYHLLGRVVEKTSGKTYATLAKELFKKCKMNETSLPALYKDGKLANSYIQKEDGVVKMQELKEDELIEVTEAAAVITTASDLSLWNANLHGGKLLKKETYQKMITPSSERDHFLWGVVGYGYGIQINKTDDLFELSHSGYYNGFNSINFYYPKTQTSVIVISNIDWYDSNFYYPVKIREMVRKILLR